MNCKIALFAGIVLVALSFSAEGASVQLQMPCFCPLNYDPYCGSNGKTYGNLCALQCDAKSGVTVSVQHQGECLPPIRVPVAPARRPRCTCPKVYDPVCASNGKTYPNQCVLNCANKARPGLDITVTKLGEC